MLLLLPAVHAEEGLAESPDQAARRPQAPRRECRAGWALGTGSGERWSEPGGLRGFCRVEDREPLPALTRVLLRLSHSVPPVPSASCPGRNCSCTRLSSTVGRSCSCVRSVGTGPPAGMACRCTSRPSTGVHRWSFPRPVRGPGRQTQLRLVWDWSRSGGGTRGIREFAGQKGGGRVFVSCGSRDGAGAPFPAGTAPALLPHSWSQLGPGPRRQVAVLRAYGQSEGGCFPC